MKKLFSLLPLAFYFCSYGQESKDMPDQIIIEIIAKSDAINNAKSPEQLYKAVNSELYKLKANKAYKKSLDSESFQNGLVNVIANKLKTLKLKIETRTAEAYLRSGPLAKREREAIYVDSYKASDEHLRQLAHGFINNAAALQKFGAYYAKEFNMFDSELKALKKETVAQTLGSIQLEPAHYDRLPGITESNEPLSYFLTKFNNFSISQENPFGAKSPRERQKLANLFDFYIIQIGLEGNPFWKENVQKGFVQELKKLGH